LLPNIGAAEYLAREMLFSFMFPVTDAIKCRKGVHGYLF